VIPVPFDYVRPETVEDALSSLAEHGDEAKPLAGGHSLLPLMKLRLATPAVVVDLVRVRPALSYVREEGDEIAVGALTRHRDLETSELLRRRLPLLSHTASLVGDPQVRHRGTIGGSIAHGDPASDLPAAVLALGGTLVAQGPSGRREIPATSFFTGFLETALSPDELLVEIRLPAPVEPLGWAYEKFNRRGNDWAIVGVAVWGDTVGLTSMSSVPMRAAATEAALAGGASIEDAAALAAEGTAPTADLTASADYRRHLARLLTRRALTTARSRAGAA
jgi:carbon-monoxide dehydrogenase medium subunit